MKAERSGEWIDFHLDNGTFLSLLVDKISGLSIDEGWVYIHTVGDYTGFQSKAPKEDVKKIKELMRGVE